MDKIYKELGWILLYICVFGLSDFYVKKYVNTDMHFLLYYVFIGILGFITIYN